MNNVREFPKDAERLKRMEERMKRLENRDGDTHNRAMNDPVSRPELDAKLETIEARMDGRIARIEDSVQRIVDMAAEIKQENRDIRMSVSNLKTTLIVTAIGAALTIVLGVAAFNATLQSNMLSAFSLGQQTSQSQSQ